MDVAINRQLAIKLSNCLKGNPDVRRVVLGQSAIYVLMAPGFNPEHLPPSVSHIPLVPVKASALI